jgi:ankyrin repeat protein
MSHQKQASSILSSFDSREGEKFLEYLEEGEIKAINQCLTKNPSLLNYKSKETGRTSLLTALLYNHNEIVTFLASKPDIDLTASDKEGWTVPILAAMHGKLELVRRAIEKCGVNATQSTNTGLTVLIASSMNGQGSVVRYLLDELKLPIEAVNHLDYTGCTALMYAAKGSHAEIVKMLVAHGADPLLTRDKVTLLFSDSSTLPDYLLK